MKMKKLLSMGAIGLVLACSTSIGASAATIPTKLMNKEALLKIITNQYKNGTNTFGVLSGVTKDTTIGAAEGSLAGASQLSIDSSHQTANKILTKVANNKDNTIATVLGKATKDSATFTKFKNDFVTVATKMQKMDKLAGTERKNAEQKVMLVVKLYDSSLDITFGKDSAGTTTASIEKSGQVLIQLNADDLTKIIAIVNDLTLEDVTNAIK